METPKGIESKKGFRVDTANIMIAIDQQSYLASIENLLQKILANDSGRNITEIIDESNTLKESVRKFIHSGLDNISQPLP